MLENIIKNLKNAYLYLADRPEYFIQKAEEEKWPGINLKLTTDYLLYNGELCAFYLECESFEPDSKSYILEKWGIPNKMQVQKPNREKLTITNKKYLLLITKLRIFYYIKNQVLPKIEKRDIKINPPKEFLNLEIKIKNQLNEKYSLNLK